MLLTSWLWQLCGREYTWKNIKGCPKPIMTLEKDIRIPWWAYQTYSHSMRTDILWAILIWMFILFFTSVEMKKKKSSAPHLWMDPLSYVIYKRLKQMTKMQCGAKVRVWRRVICFALKIQHTLNEFSNTMKLKNLHLTTRVKFFYYLKFYLSNCLS